VAASSVHVDGWLMLEGADWPSFELIVGILAEVRSLVGAVPSRAPDSSKTLDSAADIRLVVRLDHHLGAGELAADATATRVACRLALMRQVSSLECIRQASNRLVRLARRAFVGLFVKVLRVSLRTGSLLISIGVLLTCHENLVMRGRVLLISLASVHDHNLGVVARSRIAFDVVQSMQLLAQVLIRNFSSYHLICRLNLTGMDRGGRLRGLHRHLLRASRKSLRSCHGGCCGHKSVVRVVVAARRDLGGHFDLRVVYDKVIDVVVRDDVRHHFLLLLWVGFRLDEP